MVLCMPWRRRCMCPAEFSSIQMQKKPKKKPLIYTQKIHSVYNMNTMQCNSA